METKEKIQYFLTVDFSSLKRSFEHTVKTNYFLIEIKEKEATMIATDSFTLSVYKFECKSNKTVTIRMGYKQMQDVIKLGKKLKADKIKIGFNNKKEKVFNIEKTTITFPPVSGLSFIDYQNVIDNFEYNYEIKTNIDFMFVIKYALKLFKGYNSENKKIQLKFKQNRLYIKAHNTYGTYTGSAHCSYDNEKPLVLMLHPDRIHQFYKEAKDIFFFIKDKNSPIMVKTNDENYIFMMMPLFKG